MGVRCVLMFVCSCLLSGDCLVVVWFVEFVCLLCVGCAWLLLAVVCCCLLLSVCFVFSSVVCCVLFVARCLLFVGAVCYFVFVGVLSFVCCLRVVVCGYVL